jgi:hypothetical protein
MKMRELGGGLFGANDCETYPVKESQTAGKW